jgi:hypothetical protein
MAEAKSAWKVLLASNLYSIDEFLSSHPSLQMWGKQSIAISMLLAELNCRRREYIPNSPESDWLKLLWNALAAPPDVFATHQVSFITLNYDRLLEHYLTTSMANAYDVPPMVAWDAVSRLKIIHLHGQVGLYQPNGPPTRIGSHPSIGFGDQVFFPLMGECAQSFKLGWESTKDGSLVAEASRLIDASMLVVVLGIGHAISLLSPFQDSLTRVVQKGGAAHATCFGLRGAERSPFDQLRLSAGGPDLDAALLLRDKVHFPWYY